VKKALWVLRSIALILFGSGLYVQWSNKDLTELSKARRAALTELRPIILRYRADTGSFPKTLEALVPQYVPQIPAVLLNVPDVEPAKRIRYEPTDDNVRFSYHVIRGPDSTEVFDVVKNSFIRNK
jgi:hypothetical protein